MKTSYSLEKVETILSEADELVNQLNSELTDDMDDTRRIQIETHAEALKKNRREVQKNIEKAENKNSGSLGDGIHKAIEDIVAAMKALKNDMT